MGRVAGLTVVFGATLVATALMAFPASAQAASGTALPADPAPAPLDAAESSVAFETEELLSFPTVGSVLLSMVPAEAVHLLVASGPRGEAPVVSPTRLARPGDLIVFKLDELEPGAEHVYRVWCRRPGETVFSPRAAQTFRALPRDAEATVTFAFWTDSHFYQLWAKRRCGLSGQILGSHQCEDQGAFEEPGLAHYRDFQLTRQNVIQDLDLDFVVLGGDYAMTQCHTCIGCFVDGVAVPAGTVETQSAADLRYRKTFAPDAYGGVFRRLPFVNILGNHEGEAGFSSLACNHGPELRTFSTTARQRRIPNPHRVLGGDPEGRYYAFETGNVLIVVLDVMGAVDELPQTATDWTLGARQLDWLDEVLTRSDRKWKLIFAEHLDGGDPGPNSCYHYGRGSITTTDNGEATGTYLGEQARIHQLMEVHGAQILFTCHDHVATFGEKLDADGDGEGIYHVIGGSSGITSPWHENPDYRDLMDFDNDGIPEYETDVTGTTVSGYMKITARGSESLTVQYIQTDRTSCAANATPIIEMTLDGR